MPDDDRTRRRLGDETKGRIADLASGWTVESDTSPKPEGKPDSTPPAPEANATRRKAQKTVPPPPPGSAARKALEEAIVDADTPAPTRSTTSQSGGVISSLAPKPLADATGIIQKPKELDSAPSGRAPVAIVGKPSGAVERSAPVPKAAVGKATGPIERSAANVATSPVPSQVPKTSALAAEVGTAAASGSFYAKEGVGDEPARLEPKLPAGTPKGGSPARPVPPPRSAGRGGPPSAPAAKVGSSTGATPALDPSKPSAPPGAPVGSSTGPTAAIGAKVGSTTGPAAAIGAKVGSTTGPTPKIGSATGSTAAVAGKGPPKPPPPPRQGSTTSGELDARRISDRLPLRPDTTDVSGPSPAMPPPVPPARANRVAPPDVADEPAETFVDSGPPGAMPKLAVPLGEFDHGGTVLEKDKLRIAYEQSTIVRDAANALLGLPEPPQTVVKETPVEVLLHETAEHLRGDPTVSDPATVRFERGDPTRGDPTSISTSEAVASPTGVGGKVRTGAALRRKRGIGGDIRYVATVVFGIRRARRDLAELETKQAGRQQARRRHLVSLGRVAVTLESLTHPALGPARDQLASVEDERSKHSGQVAAADTELQRVKRDREVRAKQHAADVAAAEAEIVEIGKKIEPLEKDVVATKKRAGELREQLMRIDGKIAATEASLHAVNPKLDKAAIQAEIASLRADKKAVQRDEPRIAGELDALNPKIAALEARRAEVRTRRAQLDKDEADDQRRAEELLTAIGAKRKVVDRAAQDAETLRDKILFELGERLYVDRHDDLIAQLAPIDAIDVDLGTGDRTAMELREILSSVDKAKFARGLAVIVLAIAALGGFAFWVIWELL